jgi:division protein CdvB (Snf7/Vps24/ESCRT-III family)
MNKVRREQIQKVISDLTEIKERVSSIREEEEMAFDNIPEGLQDSIRGMKSQDAISSLENAEDSIDETLESLEEATY